MDKYKNSEIKPFVFSDLQGTHVVTQAKPEGYEFENLDGRIIDKNKPAPEHIRKERTFEKENSFKIDKMVREHRGIKEQESDDLEARVSAEVDRRVEAIYQQAFEEGIAKGHEEGLKQASSQVSSDVDTVGEHIAEMVNQLKGQLEEQTLKHKNEITQFVKQFSKWVLNKEIDEKVYLTYLLEKLLHELNVRRNLIIKVNEGSYEFMPEVIAVLEKKLGVFPNVRLEISSDMKHTGIILESENGIIDASLENSFAKLDRFFEQAGLE